MGGDGKSRKRRSSASPSLADDKDRAMKPTKSDHEKEKKTRKDDDKERKKRKRDHKSREHSDSREGKDGKTREKLKHRKKRVDKMASEGSDQSHRRGIFATFERKKLLTKGPRGMQISTQIETPAPRPSPPHQSPQYHSPDTVHITPLYPPSYYPSQPSFSGQPPYYPPTHTGYCPPPRQPPYYPPPQPGYYTHIQPPYHPPPHTNYYPPPIHPPYYPPSQPGYPQPNTHADPSSAPVAQTDTERDEDTASRISIEPDGDTFNPLLEATDKIHDIIQSLFDGPYTSWKKIPQNVRNIWFTEFQRNFIWLPEHYDRIRQNFERQAATLLRDIFIDLRKSKYRPIWIREAVWAELCKEWGRPEFVQLREKNKQNQAFDCGSADTSLHTKESITHTEHRRRLKEALGREPTMIELHQRTHHHQHSNQWVDQRSEHVHAEHVRMREHQTQASHGEGPSSHPSEFETLQQEARRKKKGRIYGLGSVAHTASSSSRSCYHMDSSGSTLEAAIRRHVATIEQRYLEELREIRERMDILEARITKLNKAMDKNKQLVSDDEAEEKNHDDDESTD